MVLVFDGSESGAWLDRAPADTWISSAPSAARRGMSGTFGSSCSLRGGSPGLRR